jgi:hypothetical protein
MRIFVRLLAPLMVRARRLGATFVPCFQQFCLAQAATPVSVCEWVLPYIYGHTRVSVRTLVLLPGVTSPSKQVRN